MGWHSRRAVGAGKRAGILVAASDKSQVSPLYADDECTEEIWLITEVAKFLMRTERQQ